MKKYLLLTSLIIIISLILFSAETNAYGNDYYSKLYPQNYPSQQTCLIPDGTFFPYQQIIHQNIPVNFNHIVFWIHGASCQQNYDIPAKLQIDYIKVFKEKNKKKELVYEKNFIKEPWIDPCFGGLYVRNPYWYANNNHWPIWNTYKNKTNEFVIDLNAIPNNIFHVWSPRLKYDPGAKYSLEVKTKLDGAGAYQMGVDFWNGYNNPYNGYHPQCLYTNNCEKCVSRWIGSTEGVYKTINFNEECKIQ